MAIDTIKATAILDGSVDTADLADDAVTSAKIGDGNVTGAKIGDGEVTSAKLDTNIDIAGTLDVTGATTLDDDLTIAGTATFNGSVVGIDTDKIEEGNSSVEVIDTGTGRIEFTTDGSEVMRIDDSGNVGVGTSSPISKLSISQTTASSYPTYSNPASGNGQSFFNVTLNSSDTYNGMLDIGGVTGNTDSINGGSSIRFLTQPKVSPYATIERMRIDRNGKINIGQVPSLDASQDLSAQGNILAITFGQVFGHNHIVTNCGSYTSTYGHLQFYNGNGLVGNVITNGSSTSFNTSSDYRLKENVVEMTGAIDRVKALKPSRFNFIADPDITVDGFIAHEAQDIVPESVTGEKDEVEAIGNVTDAEGVVVQEGVTEPTELPEDQTWTKTGDRPVMQGIDQSKLVPLLTGALQEAIARIETLEAEVAVLKGETP